jgi:hypothetical protein
MTRGHEGRLDCFVAEFIIGPAKGRTRWLLAMTERSRPQAKRHPEVRALARLEGWSLAPVAHPSRLADDGEHLRMTCVACIMPADYLWPDTQQKLSVGGGAWFFSQQRGAEPCQPTRTKVHATQLALAWQAPWQFSGDPLAGRLKLVISEPARSFPYSTVWAQAGAAKRAVRAKVDATMRCFITLILHCEVQIAYSTTSYNHYQDTIRA